MEEPKTDENQMDSVSQRTETPQGGKTTGRSKRLERNLDDGLLGGVLAGLSDYLSLTVDVTILRLAFLFVCLFTFPFGPICYLAAWIVMPSGGGGTEISSSRRLVKYGCTGCAVMAFFPLLVVGLLLLLPINYASDLCGLMSSDPDFFACDDISWDIRYNPDVQQLVLGALLAFVVPVISLVLLSDRDGFWGLSRRTSHLFVALIFVAGVLMIAGALATV